MVTDDELNPPPAPTFEACFHCGEILAQPPAYPLGYCDTKCMTDIHHPRKEPT